MLSLLFTSDAAISASNILRHIFLAMGTDGEDATESAYVACAYACIASENQALLIAATNRGSNRSLASLGWLVASIIQS